MTEEDELLWDSIPRGHRSEIIKSALNDWKMKATSKKYNIELLTKLEHLQKRRLELEKEYSKAEMEFNEINDEIEFIQDRMRKSDPLFIGSTDNISSSEINPDLSPCCRTARRRRRKSSTLLCARG